MGRRRGGVMSESFKYELAKDLGFYDVVQTEGWEGIRTKDAGNMVKRAIQIAEEHLAKQYATPNPQKPSGYGQQSGYVQPYAAANAHPSVAAYSQQASFQQAQSGYANPTGFQQTQSGYTNPTGSQQAQSGYANPAGFQQAQSGYANPTGSQQPQSGYTQQTGFQQAQSGYAQQTSPGYAQHPYGQQPAAGSFAAGAQPSAVPFVPAGILAQSQQGAAAEQRVY